MPNGTPPDLSKPIINEPAQKEAPANAGPALGPFEHLLGTWTNQDIAGTGKGGPGSPYSYNIMPLPQTSPDSDDGYILKNFSYFEEITFSPIHGTAPNRGGNFTQTCNVVFYEQRIYFAEGPDKLMLVHAENGSWLNLILGDQVIGPYGEGGRIPYSGPSQNPAMNIAKQISVPHGNSILVLGSHQGPVDGPVVIEDYPDAIPPKVNARPYSTEGPGNPTPALNKNPHAPIQAGAEASPAARFLRWDVSSKNEAGYVTNIPFEQKKASVSDYKATYWLQDLSGDGNYTQLSYSQTIFVDLHVPGAGVVTFPHVTCNMLTKQSG